MGKFLFRCQFQKYPCEVFALKDSILKGSVLNPQIEIEEFVNKIHPQNCGDSLKIIEKTNINKNGYLFRCQFLKYPCEILALKENIINKRVDNPALPWRNKNSLQKYIKDNFEEKPTLQELANSLNISRQEIGHSIIEFSLQNYIKYSYGKSENNLKIFIRNLLKDESINSNLSILKKYEIDIYIPSLKLGIEYNGSYWHSELYKDYLYHQEKSLLAQKMKIQLFHIFEYEFLEKEDLIKSFIKSKLGIFDKKIYARKCEVKNLDNQIYQDFCNENHLQGSCGAKVKLGLFYQNELVQIMSFSLPRFTNDFDWEIIRECSKQGYIILGGKEKLWSYFVKTFQPKSVISYCDFSKFTGNSYLKLGFKKERLNKPGFVWWDKESNQVFGRTPSKHKEMKEKYIKIYDAGQLVFVWNKL